MACVARKLIRVPYETGFFISDLAKRSIEEDFLITMLGRAIPLGTVKKSAVARDLLEVDVEKAWEEMDLNGGYSNEVTVEVFIS